MSVLALAFVEEARAGRAENMRLLIANHPCMDVNTRDHTGHTALGNAARNGHLDCVRVALEQPACDANAINGNHPICQRTALELAAMGGHEACVRALLERCDVNLTCCVYQTTALMMAAQNGHLACVQAILDRPDCDVNARDAYGQTAIEFAKKNMHEDCMDAIRAAHRGFN